MLGEHLLVDPDGNREDRQRQECRKQHNRSQLLPNTDSHIDHLGLPQDANPDPPMCHAPFIC